ncbi:MAG: T9SS type A sorting domain-containing protein, partial [Bacteroidetes bacterium]|nr:T9SS type A sorting domain-containing protein [Bacteroidota bacterium]
KNLRYNRGEASFKIDVALGDMPSFVDVDQDGDLDILSFDSEGSHVRWYENMSSTKNDFDLWLRSECWGSFEESGLNSTINLGQACKFRVVKKQAGHPGSKLLAFDADADGDFDLLISDLASANITYLENGRIETNYELDTMVSQVEKFPDYDVEADVQSFPSLSLADINLDGKQDLIASGAAVNAVSNGLVWSYLNKAEKGYEFEFSQNNFLQNTMIDLGIYTIPAFADLDADGDQDMVVGAVNHKLNDPTKEQEALVWLFENIGNDDNPVFDQIQEIQFSNKNGKEAFLSPAFGDIDNDGDIDLLLGTDDGEILLFTNSAAADEPMELTQTGKLTFDAIEAHPFVFDINNDGINDLLIGSNSGNIDYYKGLGDLDFELVTNEFGKVKTSGTYWFKVRDGEGNVIDSSLRYLPFGASRPVVYDFDQNGSPDLLVGSDGGELFYYPNFDRNKPTEAFKRDLRSYHSKSRNLNFNKLHGLYVTPYPFGYKGKMAMGHQSGGLEWFDSGQFPVGVKEPLLFVEFKVYPNPANQQITIEFDEENSSALVELYDLKGQLILQKSIEPNSTLNTHYVEPGVYVFKLITKKGVGSQKLIFTH